MAKRRAAGPILDLDQHAEVLGRRDPWDEERDRDIESALVDDEPLAGLDTNTTDSSYPYFARTYTGFEQIEKQEGLVVVNGPTRSPDPREAP